MIISKKTGKITIGSVQKWYKLSFYRAFAIVERLISIGVISKEDDIEPRKTLMTVEEFEGVWKR